jgi:DNA-binding response OmpR family regulator
MDEETFLLVDDDDELRGELASYLRRYGVRVIEVASAEAARQALLNQTVAIVISDIVMPVFLEYRGSRARPNCW